MNITVHNPYLCEQNHYIEQVDLSQEVTTNNLYILASLACFLSSI